MAYKIQLLLFGALLAPGGVWGNNSDLFNYGYTTFDDANGKSYGQPNWASITCDDSSSCTGFGEKYPFTPYDFQESLNNCRWCPESGSHDACGLHRQSPVDLKRDRGVLGGPNEKECPDWHYMQTRDDTCSFDDLRDMFTIERHGLRLEMPQQDDGQIACEEFGQRMYPRLDYSKGFPNWWFLQRTEIFVPSQHTQEGVQYAAEVVLEHFYELDHYKNQLGHVSIFLQDYPDVQPWAYLEKLICNWRIAEDKVREKCGLPAATPYGRCQLFRGQEPTPEWLAEEAGQIFPVEVRESPFFNVTPPIDLGPTTPTLLDTHAPFPPVSPPVGGASGSSAPVSPPVFVPTTPSPVIPIPVVFITPSPVEAPVSTDPPPVQCDAWDINYNRMCVTDKSDDPCCGDERSDTAYCWGIYDQLGSAVSSVCHHCCDSPQSVGPAAPVRDDLPLQLQCSALDNIPHRMCKTDSCCSDPRSESEYCKSQYHAFNDNELAQICHYCCSTPEGIGPALGGRNLRSGTSMKETIEDDRVLEGAKEFNVFGKKFLLGKENFDPIEEDEQTYFDRQYAAHQRRNQQTIHDVNYEDLEWSAYEWLFRVETEYYFRYEGTMVQPPCWEVVHWRNMKDPIRVHKRQIDELNRLMAWRLNPDTCARETAGIVSADSASITANREIQYMHDQHRFVFCECKDWPSKFKGDREWCHRHNEDTSYTRFYEHPYSFDENAGWLP